MALQSLSMLLENGCSINSLQRHQHDAPGDNGAFILPIKQTIMRDKRISFGTRCMIALLAGWGGKRAPIETYVSSIGKHLGVSRQQVHKYLNEAERYKYIKRQKRKNHIGMVVGIRILLNPLLIWGGIRTYQKKRIEDMNNSRIAKFEKQTKNVDIQAVNHSSHINENISIINRKEQEFQSKIAAILKRIE